MKSKRPWKKYAKIERIELNSGDVKFRAYSLLPEHLAPAGTKGEFESLTEAEAHLDAWWAEYWPKQVKSRRPA
jgi:hypothetical protein